LRKRKRYFKSTEILGLVVILAGLLILFYPSAFISSFSSIIEPGAEVTGSNTVHTGGADFTMYYSIKNTVVTSEQDLSLYIFPWYAGGAPNLPQRCYAYLSIDDELVGVESTKCKGLPDYASPVKYGPANFTVPLSNFANYDLEGKQTVRLELSMSQHDDSHVSTPAFITDFEAWIDSPLCSNQEGYVWVVENFDSGQTISIDKLRYKPAAFCANRPILVHQMGTVVEQKVEEMSLIKRSFVTVPVGQLWEISYLVNENELGDVPVDCVSFDAEKGICVDQPTIVYTCTGILTEDGECIEQLTTRCVDEEGNDVEGAFYDAGEGKCVKVIPTELKLEPAECPSGSKLVIEEGIEKCVFDTPVEFKCDGRLDFSTDPPTCLGFVNYEVSVLDIVSANILGGVNNYILVIGIIIIIIGGLFLFKKI